ncbi:MerR family transcriptional regulator [Couchioplanes caeruleus]|uniref:MerR family transcriptional regulator n=2 Tax=Couchioplanes caeruleus TaxID=56438 RepID=A0A1K0FLW2_9ACTN|nr:MerR family transcriptional regulator [Couchioplanes caeruleus]OJF13720.1 MerR family transcriptional regulator [Couchioplanes caeruleus subsp. caeruleus]ROP32462.1 DNA-binding transcriptional MerR regulator [Couchioplanes caeruleus]
MVSPAISIAEVAERTGLSKDTLRWYEAEGLIPSVHRDASGHRAYDDAAVRVIELVVRLRRTGMPVRDTKDFIAMTRQGAATHGRRLALLREHRERVRAHLAQLEGDLHAIEDKIDHYVGLISEGRDCDASKVTDPAILAQQRSLG